MRPCFLISLYGALVLIGSTQSALAQQEVVLTPAIEIAQAQTSPQEIEHSLQLTRSDRRLIQSGLNAIGYPVGSVDGLFGPQTRRRLHQWQSVSNLPPTGYLTASQVTFLSQQGSTLYYTTNPIPLFTAPHTQSTLIVTIQANSGLIALKRQANWLYVQYNQHQGWLIADHLENISMESTTFLHHLVPYDLPLRRWPHAQASEIHNAFLRTGQIVTVTGQTANRTWLRIGGTQQIRGYVKGQALPQTSEQLLIDYQTLGASRDIVRWQTFYQTYTGEWIIKMLTSACLNVSDMSRIIHRWSYDADVLAATYSADGTRILVGTGGAQDSAYLYDASSGQQIHHWPHRGAVLSVAFSPDDTMIATGSSDNAVHLFDANSGQNRRRWTLQDDVKTIAFSPDGTYLAASSADFLEGIVYLYDIVSGEEVHSWRHRGLVEKITFSPDGQWLAVATKRSAFWTQGWAYIYDISSGQMLRRWQHQDDVLSIDFSPDGTWIATGGADKVVRLLEVNTGLEVRQWILEERVWSIRFSSDNRFLVTGNGDWTGHGFERIGSINLLHVQKQRPLGRWIYRDHIKTVALSPDGLLLVAGGLDGTARMLSMMPSFCLGTL